MTDTFTHVKMLQQDLAEERGKRARLQCDVIFCNQKIKSFEDRIARLVVSLNSRELEIDRLTRTLRDKENELKIVAPEAVELPVGIKTNGKLYTLKAYCELPKKVYPMFSVSDRYEARFVKFGGGWYDTNGTKPIVIGDYIKDLSLTDQPIEELMAWDTIHTMIPDSLLGAVVFRFVGDKVQIGRCMFC